MNPTRMPAWRITLTIAIVLCAGFAKAGEVTVVGSSRPCLSACEFDDAQLLTEPSSSTSSPSKSNESAWSVTTDSSSGSFSTPMPELEETIDPNADVTFQIAPYLFTCAQRPSEVAWYARFDYFTWDEQANCERLTHEDGVLYTLGFVRSSGFQRFRFELFTGDMVFACATQNHNNDKVFSDTNYLGLRGEYELLWDVNLNGWPRITFFTGVGTRFWIRDIKDGTYSSDYTEYWTGFQETWWTIYPYWGLEKSWMISPCDVLFARGRFGLTAFTSALPSYLYAPTLNPRPGFTSQAQIGWRHEQFFAMVYFEAMTWAASLPHRGVYQPQSNMFTTGLQLGFSY